MVISDDMRQDAGVLPVRPYLLKHTVLGSTMHAMPVSTAAEYLSLHSFAHPCETCFKGA